jgi:hypothetical protein
MSAPGRRHSLPDGREVHAVYEGEPVGWVAHLAGAEEHPVAGRDMHDVLIDLLEPRAGRKPVWFEEAVSALTGHDTPVGHRFACPCCGYLTLDEPPSGTFAICKVCRWEDDNVQFRDRDYTGGANMLSLNHARENFRRLGVSDPRFLKLVRPPRPEERP